MAHSQRTTPTSAPTSTFSSTHRLTTQALFAAAVALLVLAWWLRSPLHHMPLERDEGAYAVIAALGQLRWLGRWPARLLGMALLCALLAPPVYEIWPLRTLSPDQQIRALYGHDGDQFFWPATIGFYPFANDYGYYLQISIGGFDLFVRGDRGSSAGKYSRTIANDAHLHAYARKMRMYSDHSRILERYSAGDAKGALDR